MNFNPITIYKYLKVYKSVKNSALFDSKYYLFTYPDVRTQYIDPIKHYILHGAKEGRNPSAHFNTNYYLSSHKDININKINPLYHYIVYGYKEGRLTCNNANYSNIEQERKKKLLKCDFFLEDENYNIKNQYKVALVIHVYYMNLLDTILDSVKNLDYKFDIFFTVNEENFISLEKKLKTTNLTNIYKIKKVPNLGYDIFPFINILKDLKKENYQLICKLHTKKGAANLEKIVPNINNLWSDMLVKSIIGSSNIVNKILYAFENNLDLCMIGCADFYKSSKFLMYQNEKYVSEIFDLLNIKIDIDKECGFFAGTMFWAKIDLFEPFISQYDKVEKLFSIDNMQSTGQISSYSHAMERVFGFLGLKYKVGLSYAIDINRLNHIIGISDKNLNNRFGIGMTLENESNIDKNLKIIKNSGIFDSQSYRESYLQGVKKFDEHLHFLRYGSYWNYSPNKHFDMYSYWDEHKKTYIHRKNAFVDSILNNRNVSLPSLLDVERMIHILTNSKYFDKRYYLNEYVDIKNSNIDPLSHYVRIGWKENRIPSQNFDIFWYQEEYLQDFLEPVNPILYHELIGRQKGYKTKPTFQGFDKRIKLNNSPKRICLFAAYDKSGIVDESVIVFIKELAKYCDVYFLSDSDVSQMELDKLNPYVKGSWGYRHGEYDFGSYKRLAKNHVGWDEIEKYDELLFVNDSSYLISSLEPVFKKMDKKEISWWGLQATKGIYATKDKQSNSFKNKISIEKIKNKYLKDYFEENDFDFLIGSYFLAYRKNIITDKKFQNIINNISKQRDKKTLILKYEIGLTRYLISQKYDFDTFMDHLYPFHPIYTDVIYEMIKDGFPLFKRFFLTENHYKQKKLYLWKEKLLELCPNLDIKPIEENLYRVADTTKLYKNLDIENRDVELLNNAKITKLDKSSIVDKNLWIFPVCAYNHNLDDNVRAVFEEVKNDETITKVVLFREKTIDVDGKNVIIIPLYSKKAQEYLLKSQAIFIKHSPIINIPFPLDYKKHKFINLWHGIPLKRIGVASLDTQNNLDSIINNHNKKCYCTIASSDIDKLAMTATFYPLTYNDVWLTGLPRHDFILQPSDELPNTFQDELEQIDDIIDDRRFILYAPTFRNAQQDAYYNFTDEEKKRLYKYLEKNNIVLGIREHMADTAHSYTAELKHSQIFSAGSHRFETIEMLYRKADLLITDYSSCFIDFILTDKPMISFAYDYKNYKEKERGMFYDLNFVFPGDICQSFEQLLNSLNKYFKNGFKNDDEAYNIKKQFFHKYADDKNSQRVVELTKRIKD